ncbi:6799_t:CDS:1, partial [Funneliformis geosporum]
MDENINEHDNLNIQDKRTYTLQDDNSSTYLAISPNGDLAATFNS